MRRPSRVRHTLRIGGPKTQGLQAIGDPGAGREPVCWHLGGVAQSAVVDEARQPRRQERVQDRDRAMVMDRTRACRSHREAEPERTHVIGAAAAHRRHTHLQQARPPRGHQHTRSRHAAMDDAAAMQKSENPRQLRSQLGDRRARERASSNRSLQALPLQRLHHQDQLSRHTLRIEDRRYARWQVSAEGLKGAEHLLWPNQLAVPGGVDHGHRQARPVDHAGGPKQVRTGGRADARIQSAASKDSAQPGFGHGQLIWCSGREAPPGPRSDIRWLGGHIQGEGPHHSAASWPPAVQRRTVH